ncbi:hypothetical protein V6259_13010 [Marinomonas sp. TI.3.20]|uniref:hypothetical protein n=1 Tax=Marinomonas sp. TI.3.20 TaxID=3121296 RepID=UPI00311DF93F
MNKIDDLEQQRKLGYEIAPFANKALKTIGEIVQKGLDVESGNTAASEMGAEMAANYFQTIHLDLLNSLKVEEAKATINTYSEMGLIDNLEYSEELLSSFLQGFASQFGNNIKALDMFGKLSSVRPASTSEKAAANKDYLHNDFVITVKRKNGEENHISWSGQGRRARVLSEILKDPMWVTTGNIKKYISEHDMVEGQLPDGEQWQIWTKDAFNAAHKSAVSIAE